MVTYSWHITKRKRKLNIFMKHTRGKNNLSTSIHYYITCNVNKSNLHTLLFQGATLFFHFILSFHLCNLHSLSGKPNTKRKKINPDMLPRSSIRAKILKLQHKILSFTGSIGFSKIIGIPRKILNLHVF